jgi:hypothetical protein
MYIPTITTGGLVEGVSGIYPRFLDIQDASTEIQVMGNFMDLHIEWHYATSVFVTGVFDKRRSPPYAAIPNILTLQSAHSCLAETCKFGVIFLQLWRFRLRRILCTTAHG